MTTNPHPAQLVQADDVTARTVEVPTGRAVIASPVGAIVTDDGQAFAVEPLDVTALPVRVRCTCCPWQATATGLTAASAEASRHAAAHRHDPRPVSGTTAIGSAR